MFYEIALRCAAGDDLRLALRQVVAKHVKTPREIRRVRERYKEFARMYGSVAHEYLRTEPYDRIRHSDAPNGTRARVQANAPDWEHASWNGWFAVQEWTGGEWIIERHLCRILTPEEHNEQAAAYYATVWPVDTPAACLPSMVMSTREGA
jgi:hypothetical protein